MKMLKRGEKGFTLIELLIVVAILGVLAAVVIPNVGRFIGEGEEEAKDTEFSTIQSALHAMMVDNEISTVGVVYDATNATNDMSVFPSSTNPLYGHSGTINYVATNTTSYWYYCDTYGTISQLDAAP
jgi:type IV pilus assembly protein PilA